MPSKPNTYKPQQVADTERHVFYPNEDKWLTLPQAAEALHVPLYTVRRLRRQGLLRGKQMHTPHLHWIVDPASVERCKIEVGAGPVGRQKVD